MRPGNRRRLQIIVFLIGLAALFGVTVYAGANSVMRILGTLRLFGFATITVMHLPTVALMGLAWWCVGREAGRPVLFVGARLVRDSVAETLPFSQIGGFLSALRVMALAGSNVLGCAIAMLADLLLEFYAKLFYTLLGIMVLVWLLPGARLVRLFSTVLICLFAASAVFMFFQARFKIALNRLLQWGIRRSALLPHDGTIELGFARNFTRKRGLASFAIHAGCWLFGAAEAWVTLRLIGIDVGGPQALVIDSLATAFRSFGFLVPAALGVQEAGYVLVCALLGISPAGAVAFSLSRRARDLLLGLVGLLIWQGLEIRAYRRHPQRGA
ncbi:MAG TPA: lysylphosphatidylglycerol synthase domain-containing protein [Rhizomicrobium sp.]|nr:lysylphosphatidylglycerol synthase domain-containing protein [Rhizomicrobium sp.]